MNSNRLYKNRTVSESLNIVFDFVGENWRTWLKTMFYFLMPFSVLLGTTLATFYKDTDITSMSETGYAISIVLFVIGCAVVTALEILLIKWYDSHNGTLDGCDASTLWRMMPKTSLKLLGSLLLDDPLLSLATLSSLIPLVGFGVILGALPVFLLCPIMLLESGNSLPALFKRAFSLGYKKWGTLILVAVVMGLVAVLLNNAVTFPLSLFMVFESVLDTSDSDSVLWSFFLDVIRYILCVAGCFVIFVEQGLFVLAMTYHYGSVATEVEDIDLESDIDNFAQLK